MWQGPPGSFILGRHAPDPKPFPSAEELEKLLTPSEQQSVEPSPPPPIDEDVEWLRGKTDLASALLAYLRRYHIQTSPPPPSPVSGSE